MSLKIGKAVEVGEFWYIRNKGCRGLYVGKVLSIDGRVTKVQTSTYTSHVQFIEADVDAVFVQKREAHSYD
jgi:hypothetical protein